MNSSKSRLIVYTIGVAEPLSLANLNPERFSLISGAYTGSKKGKSALDRELNEGLKSISTGSGAKVVYVYKLKASQRLDFNARGPAFWKNVQHVKIVAAHAAAVSVSEISAISQKLRSLNLGLVKQGGVTDTLLQALDGEFKHKKEQKKCQNSNIRFYEIFKICCQLTSSILPVVKIFIFLSLLQVLGESTIASSLDQQYLGDYPPEY